MKQNILGLTLFKLFIKYLKRGYVRQPEQSNNSHSTYWDDSKMYYPKIDAMHLNPSPKLYTKLKGFSIKADQF